MNSSAVRATALKNSDNLMKSSEVRFVLVKLPSTKIFNVVPNDSGMSNLCAIWNDLDTFIDICFIFLLNFKFRCKKCFE